MAYERLLPRTRKLSPLCTTSLLFGSPGLPVPRGVSGGGAALSPGFQLNLCSLPKHGAHFAAQSPERSFFFPLFLSAEKEKEVIGDDAVAKSLSLKQKVTFAGTNALARYTSSPPAGGAVSLRLGQARFSVSTGDRFIAAPLLRSPRGEG